MKKLLSLFAVAGMMASFQSSAVITYANCPTLTPLPVTSFMPGAMMPIKNTQTAFDVGMNQVVRQAVTAASQLQIQAIETSFNSVMQNMIETSQAHQKDLMDLEIRFQEMEMAYEAKLSSQKENLERMIFPGDPSMMPVEEGQSRTINESSPSYKFIREMCTAGKTQQMLASKNVVSKALENKNRREQKITANLQAVSSVDSRAKENIDKHYDLFCSEDDVEDGLCEISAPAPNADLDAFVFMFPSGYLSSGAGTAEYQTMYTYSPVESLASYQYIKHLTGTLHVSPPTTLELNDPKRVRFISAYKQAVAASSLSADTLLSIAQMREPVNSEGLIVGRLDALNYLIDKSKMPDQQRILKSASEEGKLLEMQRLLSLQQKIQLMLLKQKDRERQLKAARLAVENTLNIPRG